MVSTQVRKHMARARDNTRYAMAESLHAPPREHLVRRRISSCYQPQAMEPTNQPCSSCCCSIQKSSSRSRGLAEFVLSRNKSGRRACAQRIHPTTASHFFPCATSVLLRACRNRHSMRYMRKAISQYTCMASTRNAQCETTPSRTSRASLRQAHGALHVEAFTTREQEL